MEKDEIAQRLKVRKAELMALAESRSVDRASVELDQSKVGRLSRMDALQQQAMSQAIEARRQLDVRRIDAALRRLEEDEYGYCLECGEDIEAGRLNIDPAITLCRQCAEKIG